ncbi:S49 family peptidase [Candidatus Parcubacteria bacterium]|nr:S49 family peptidase [Candidatus Parcubacteria bacterium]
MEFKLFNKERDWKLLKRVAFLVILIAALIIVKDEIVWQLDLGDWAEDGYYEEGYDLGCNVVGAELHGYLDVSVYEEGDVSSDNIVWTIESAEQDESIKAIILDIDSTGGDPVAAEEIANALKRATKPTIALIRSYGLSAAYFGATGADIIFASAISDVGSIGITYSYVDNAKRNQVEGLTYNQISSGKFKNMLDPDKPLTYEERQLLERDMKIIHENFVEAVAENRGLDIEKVRALADGSSILGQMALENGLIDKIGDLYDVREYLEGIIDEEAVVCWE